MAFVIRNFSRNIRAGGKFVAFRNGGDPAAGLLALSDFSLDSQHRDIVRRLENALGSPLAASGWVVDGGGWWRMRDDRTLFLYGTSAAYGRYDSEWLRDRIEPGSVMGEHEVVVE